MLEWLFIGWFSIGLSKDKGGPIATEFRTELECERFHEKLIRERAAEKDIMLKRFDFGTCVNKLSNE